MMRRVKYNPAPWIGVAVRPEYVRRTVYAYPDYVERKVTSGRLYTGVELGSVRGLALSIGGVATLAAVVIAAVASGGFD